ncbi:hypothetical protein NM688_g8129 [Phlebia brevispora]|uniref:Uncharacterized protein n=1 Tax=Phlebia brevispora TaxID=194682 RepID=A0ACC1RWZ4_9APHY|nr:hypothetical protein NM688_g8129 [Phlebia brevispora]
MVSKCAALRRRLQNLQTVQSIYMPCVPQLLAHHLQTNPAADTPEDQPVFFPHQLTFENLEQCNPGVADIKEHLRDAQLSKSLDRLCVQLHIKARLITFKNQNVQHQGLNMHARWRIEVNQSKITTIADKYRAAHVTKLALTGPGDWKKEWQLLKPGDDRTLLLNDDPINSSSSKTHSEGRRTTLWIWMSANHSDVDSAVQLGMQQAIRIDLEYYATLWDCREKEGLREDTVEGQGRAVYAARQAFLRRSLAKTFASKWVQEPTTKMDNSSPTNETENEDNITVLIGDNGSDRSDDEEETDIDDV